MNRSNHLAALSGGQFDVLVIGGGITGAGIAWDAALRGLSVALLERTDFGAGTSGVSSKMVHAGLRYMFGDPELVREASVERQRMFRAGGHLARPLEYYVPVYDDTPEYGLDSLPGILARYDELADYRNASPHRLLDPARIARELPALRAPLRMVGSYWDGVMDDARLTVEVIHSAAEAGARVLNHAPVIGFLTDRQGRVVGARFRDEAPTGGGAEHSVAAKAVVSAAGVYTDLLLGLEPGGTREPVLRPSKGVHLVFRSRLTGGKALTIPMGGNILTFVVPLFQEYLAMGTTDTDYPVRGYGDLDRVPVAGEDVRYNLEILQSLFPGVFAEKDIVACYSGVRPLVRPKTEPGQQISESDTSRTHRIWRTPAGIWAIAGGKYTTFRLMAEQMVDAVVASLRERGVVGKVAPCSTVERRYHGAPALEGRAGESEEWLSGAAAEAVRRSDLAADCCLHLCEAYGIAAGEVLELIRRAPQLGERLGAGRPVVLAEIRHAVEREMCCTLGDFLIRRTPLRFMEHQGLDVAPQVSEELAGLLGWSPAVTAAQLAQYREYLEGVWTPGADTRPG
ncbi:MAG: glycerol-3-phosphate dehydrogenase/oxidase [Spirochaetales bacterium]|nr:glycerol-3-phosphate dehydrogenase/oxidase [Spirochaetales bacterium]